MWLWLSGMRQLRVEGPGFRTTVFLWGRSPTPKSQILRACADDNTGGKRSVALKDVLRGPGHLQDFLQRTLRLTMLVETFQLHNAGIIATCFNMPTMLRSTLTPRTLFKTLAMFSWSSRTLNPKPCPRMAHSFWSVQLCRVWAWGTSGVEQPQPLKMSKQKPLHNLHHSSSKLEQLRLFDLNLQNQPLSPETCAAPISRVVCNACPWSFHNAIFFKTSLLSARQES